MTARDEEAVSPVMGVLLTVVITVTLAAVVFVVVRGIGDQPGSNARIAIARNDLTGRLTILQAQDVVDRADIQVRLQGGGHFALNGPASLGSTDLPDGAYVALTATRGTAITAGDYIEFCGASTPEPVQVTLRVLRPTGVVVYNEDFNYMAQCA